jgi:hypothetical protein
VNGALAQTTAHGPWPLYLVAAIGFVSFPLLHLWDIPLSTFYGATAALGGGFALQYTRLTVRVTPRGLQWRLALTPGWHTIPAGDLAGGEAVVLAARRGVGTRLTAAGTLHNVGAPTALRIRRVKNEDLLLGTNAPEDLIRAIDAVRPR